MKRVILQPTGKAIDNYVNTIENPVTQEKINEFEPEISGILRMIYGDNSVPIWGVTPGKTTANETKWNKISSGDIVLFLNNGRAFSTGIVTKSFRNQLLAKYLWGENEDNQTWEFIYLLDEIKLINIPYKFLNISAGYAENYVVQGFNVLDEEKSNKVLESFSLDNFRYEPEFDEHEIDEIMNSLAIDDTLDVERVVKSRKEQAFIKKVLFGDKTEDTCHICLKVFPKELELV